MRKIKGTKSLFTAVDAIDSLLDELSRDKASDGSFRFPTGCQYPDGSQVDVFLSPDYSVLSDKGLTTAYLLDLNVVVPAAAIEEVCAPLGVTLRGGQLETAALETYTSGQPHTWAYFRLAEACSRVASLGHLSGGDPGDA